MFIFEIQKPIVFSMKVKQVYVHLNGSSFSTPNGSPNNISDFVKSSPIPIRLHSTFFNREVFVSEGSVVLINYSDSQSGTIQVGHILGWIIIGM